MKNEIILEVFENKQISAYCQSLDGQNWQELRSELVIQLFKMPESKLTEYYSKNCLTYICFTIIKRIKYGTISDTGLFYNKDKLNLEFYDEYHTEQVEDVVLNDDKIDMIQKLESELKSLHWYSKILFEMYYKDNLTLKQISHKTGINLKSIHYSINKTRLKLKKKLKED